MTLRINDVTYVKYFISLLVYSKCSIYGTHYNHFLRNDSKLYNCLNICFFNIQSDASGGKHSVHQTGSLPKMRKTSEPLLFMRF